ncbi:reverse transcriptase/maturase family protein [candidate division KSB1 bacterium]|nr:reverse transcriptase/maturase family protein [candidate division KSB1 bacterium]
MENLLHQLVAIPNLEAAWQRVLANAGCRGSDGVTVAQFAARLETHLRDLSNCLAKQEYHPYPLLRFPILKDKSREASGILQVASHSHLQPATSHLPLANLPLANLRFLSVPTVRDRVAQTAAFLVTKEIFEAEFEDVSHAYREGRGVRTAVYDIKEWRDKGYRWAVDADITAYFDNVPHERLLARLKKLIPDPAMLRLFEKWIRAEVYDGARIWTLDKGIPQGSVVSPALANLFLDELDETLMSFGMKLVRFADDFLILAKSEKEAEDAIEITGMLLDDMQIDLNPLKTKIVHFDKGFKFLGAIFLGGGIFVPFPQKREQGPPPKLPPALTLRRYLELKNK